MPSCRVTWSTRRRKQMEQLLPSLSADECSVRWVGMWQGDDISGKGFSETRKPGRRYELEGTDSKSRKGQTRLTASVWPYLPTRPPARAGALEPSATWEPESERSEVRQLP